VIWILQGSAEHDGRTFVFRLPRGETRVIGRAPGADFIMEAALVSRLHCRISAGAAGVEVTDLDSTNGTFVNGARVSVASLGDGDRLRVGRVELLISRED
jgi:pSer/pThr/pTyr-binding forkhead associated (FHA) protein